MTTFDWNAILHLPDMALAGDRRIPKTMLVRQARLTKAEQRVLDHAGTLSHFATVQKSTTHIPPTVDSDHDIQSVLFLRCEMVRGSAYTEMAKLIHKCFPNPTIILFDGVNESCISAARTRRSLAEKASTVIEKVESTRAFEPQDPLYEPFLRSLDFNRLPQTDLLSYLDGIIWNIRLSRTSKRLGFYPHFNGIESSHIERLLDEWEELFDKTDDVRRRWKDKNLSLNDSARLRITLKQLEKKLGQVEDSIKEACND